ncbi:MAG: DUF4399 domain-containing protein [Woeseiaceae bacterium]
MIRPDLAITALALTLCLSACGERSTPISEKPAMSETATEAAPAVTPETAVRPRTASPEGARVFFITPADGDTVSNPIDIEFGIDVMNVAKAGDKQADSGHHHLLIDTDLPELTAPVPSDANHVHFGDGSTRTEITLDPGQHTLRLLLADHLHIPHDPPVMSEVITITVE